MLRASVISFGMGWEKCLPFAEFAYNNSYQASLGKAPFEVLYGRKCRTPLNWSETRERQLFGPDMIQEAEEQVRVIREKLKTAQSRQKSQYDHKHKHMTYEVGEKAYLRVTPLKGTHRFGIKGKLSLVTSDPFAFLPNEEKFPTNWNYLRIFPEFTMSSTSLNSGVASRILSMEWTTKRLIYKITSHTGNIPFVSLIKSSVPLDAIISSFSRFNGHTIPRKKPLGKGRIVFDSSTPPSSRRILNLGTRFF